MNSGRVSCVSRAREKGGRPASVHTVQMKFLPLAWLEAWPDEDHASRLVFIGRDLDAAARQERFETRCV
jgi:hypothetical protein